MTSNYKLFICRGSYNGHKVIFFTRVSFVDFVVVVVGTALKPVGEVEAAAGTATASDTALKVAAKSRVSARTMRFRSTGISIWVKAMGSPITIASAWPNINIPQSEVFSCCCVPAYRLR